MWAKWKNVRLVVSTSYLKFVLSNREMYLFDKIIDYLKYLIAYILWLVKRFKYLILLANGDIWLSDGRLCLTINYLTKSVINHENHRQIKHL